jgi:hypothetical protein
VAEDTGNERAPQEPDEERTIERIIPEGKPVFYANIAAIGSTIWDFTLDFGLIQETGKEGVVFRDMARIIMSPPQAQVFAEILTQHVKQYQEKFGPIPRPEELITVDKVTTSKRSV